MKTHLAGKLLMAGALLAAPLLMWAQSDDGKVAAASPSAQTATDTGGSDATKQDKALELGQSPAPALSAGIEEILKMVDAKVSPDVIKAYVESAAVGCNLAATDIVALKAGGVRDDITTALVKRSAEVGTQVRQAGADSSVTPPTPLPAAKSSAKAYARSYALDPESYEYFQYYYLQPRTLASVCQRLSPYYSHSYGYNAPLPYGVYNPGRRSHAYRGGFHSSGFPPPHGSRW